MPTSLDILDAPDAIPPAQASVTPIEAEARAQVRSELEHLRAHSQFARSSGIATHGADVLVVVGRQAASSLRAYAKHSLVLEIPETVWDLRGEVLKPQLGAGTDWLNLGKTALVVAAQEAADTIARLCLQGHSLVLGRHPAAEAIIAWVLARGAPFGSLAKQARWMPSIVSFHPAVLQEWVGLGCPGEAVDLDACVRTARERWAFAVYEAVFPLLLQARQRRDGVPLESSVGRPILNLLSWLKDSSDTALRAAAVKNGEYVDAGHARCSAKLGMLLTGVQWRVVAAVECSSDDDCSWLSFLHSDTPETKGLLAGVGWDGATQTGGADFQVAAMTLAQAAELELHGAGLIRRTTSSGTALASDIICKEGGLWRRGAVITPAELAQSSGATGPLLDAVRGRTAYHVSRSLCGRPVGVRRRFKLTLQRAVGAAEFPPPEIVLNTTDEFAGTAEQWKQQLFTFRVGMPIDRRRRDLWDGIAVLRDASFIADPLTPSSLIGTSVAGGLISIDASTVFYAGRGEALAGYIWSNLSHCFQPEYARWVRATITSRAGNDDELRSALQQVISDLATVLV